jgi:hypothetical protein
MDWWRYAFRMVVLVRVYSHRSQVGLGKFRLDEFADPPFVDRIRIRKQQRDDEALCAAID